MPSSGSGISDPISGGGGLSTAIYPRSQPRTLLSIERFAQLVSYSPMLMHQVYVPELQDISSCSDPILQYTWQPRAGGRPGREEIAHAIQQAETTLEEYLGFSVLPRWYVDDDAPVMGTHYGYKAFYRLGVRTKGGHFVQGGQEAWTLVASSAPVAYTDRDGDGYLERATVTVNTAVTDDDEIAVYYPGTQHDPGWEIRPIEVSITGGVATIRFYRHQCVIPERIEELDANGVLGTDNNQFLGSVDVYRHYNDPSKMGIVEWEGGICDTDGCVWSAQTACVLSKDDRNGLLQVSAADWDGTKWVHTCPTWWTPPTRVRLWYRAGLRDKTLARPMRDMSRELERAEAYLALSYMDRAWQSCEQIRNLQAHWRQDLSVRESTQGGSMSFNMSRRLLDNPLGTTRAAVHAWNVVQRMSVGEAVLG